MFLARLSVHRPVLTTMMILVLVVVGVRSYLLLSQDLFPSIEFPFVMVQTIYPGAGPKEVESQVTKLIEDEVFSISNLDEMQSQSREALSFVFLQFELGADADLKAIEVKDKIELIRANLPDDAKPPAVLKYDFSSEPVMRLAISSPRSLEETYRLADRDIKDALGKVEGVSSVEIIGGRQREIRVAMDREALRAYGLSPMNVTAAVAGENVDFPVGRIISTDKELSLRLQGKFQNLEQIRRVRINTPAGKSVYLSDVADVLDTVVEPRDNARFQNKETVTIQIFKKSDSNAVTVSDGVQKQMEYLKTYLPSDVDLAIVRDTSEYIRNSVSNAWNNILQGILLTAILLWLFLHEIRATFIAAISIPAAIVATFAPMLASGFTVNVISLMGLGVSIGTLVANAIVVLESISAEIAKGATPADAAVDGTTGVAIAVVASALTNLVVFTPIAFMEGIVGQIFKQFGLTVVYATIFSLIMSFTLVPMLAAAVYRKGGKRHELRIVHRFSEIWDHGYNGVAQAFGRSIAWSLRHRWVVIVGTFGAFAFGMFLFVFIGQDFFPQSDENFFSVNVLLPAGTSLQKTDEVLQEVDGLIRKAYDKYIISSIQAIGGTGKGVEEGSVVFKLVDKAERDLSVNQLVAKARPILARIPAAEIDIGTSEHGGGGGLEIEVTGANLKKTNEYAEQVMALARKITSLVDVRSTYVTGKPELTFIPDRQQMAAYGVSTAMVGLLLRAVFEGDVSSRYSDEDEEYDIRVQMTENERARSSDFEDIFLRIGEQQVPISQLGAIVYTTAETEILRKDKQRMVQVQANIATGTLGDAQTSLQAAIEENIELAPGYKIHFGGQSKWMAETFSNIFQALILAIILTYMVLAATLESFVHPITIMLTLPLGLIGVSMSLFLSGISLNMFSLMAIVMLVGIVVNNAILILDLVNQLRIAGKEVREALVEATVVRLRPIIMMNSAIAISLVPQTLPGAGSEISAAIAMVTIGGVIVSSVFTLYLIPVMYTYFDRLAKPPRAH